MPLIFTMFKEDEAVITIPEDAKAGDQIVVKVIGIVNTSRGMETKLDFNAPRNYPVNRDVIQQAKDRERALKTT